VPEPDFLVDPEREKPRLVPRFLSPDARFLLPDDEPPGSALATCRGARRLLWNGRGLLGRPGPQLARLLAELSRGAADRVADPSCCLAGELADSLADAAERLSGAGLGLCSPGSRGPPGSGRASQRAVEDVVQVLEPYLQLRLGFNACNVDLEFAETTWTPATTWSRFASFARNAKCAPDARRRPRPH
jgi:hypothetical protein